MRKLLKNIGKVATPVSKKGLYHVEVIENVGIALKDDKIEYIDSMKDIRVSDFGDVYDCRGMLATPGLIDCHTHPVFAATREDEFHLRNTGVSYAEIAAKGGGIKSSVRKLREAPLLKLIEALRKRFDEFITLGTTTIEAKSGYGLSLEHETRQLEAIKALRGHSLEVSPTFLGAHEIPDEYRDNRDEYIRIVIEEMIPTVAEEKLAESCDIFIEKNVYTNKDARKIMGAAKKAGLNIRMHVDQLTAGGGAELAAEVGAVSAEHLDYVSDKGIKRMVEKGVVFDLLPGAVFFLGHEFYPPARKIIKKGGIIALATDFNPGSSMTRSLPLIMTLGCIYMGMNADEALSAVTLNAAKSLKRDKMIGSLEPGKQADIVLWDAPGHEYIPYHYGENRVNAVFKKGELVYSVL